MMMKQTPGRASSDRPPAAIHTLGRTVLAHALAAGALCAVAQAQGGPPSYASNWQPMLDTASAAFTGPSLFGPGTSGSVSGVIRRCYGIDATQGGRNQSAGVLTNTWFKTAQGFAATNQIPGVDLGLISIQAASSSDSGADVCLSPFFLDPTSTGGHKVLVGSVPGIQSGTSAGPFPQVWESAFQWIGSAVSGPTTLGLDGAGNPLLINLIYEIQGPLTQPGETHYYLASTTEVTGTMPSTPGGVTNGNGLWGTSVYAAPPELSGAVSHSRIIGSGGAAGAPFLVAPGDLELLGTLAFETPALWATNDGNAGAGGTDWRVGTAPVSLIDLRLLDVRAGNETNSNINFPLPGPPSPIYDPNIVLNRSWFVWSATAASSMLQRPMSWDDMGGTLAPQPGSVQIGLVATKRAGLQTVPATLDGLTLAVLPLSALTLGSKFSDASLLTSVFEGQFSPITSGVSTLASGALPFVGQPTPSLVGVKLGVAAVGLQVNLTDGPFLQMTEWANALTINLQP